MSKRPTKHSWIERRGPLPRCILYALRNQHTPPGSKGPRLGGTAHFEAGVPGNRGTRLFLGCLRAQDH